MAVANRGYRVMIQSVRGFIDAKSLAVKDLAVNLEQIVILADFHMPHATCYMLHAILPTGQNDPYHP
jgi:hypothetical protein